MFRILVADSLQCNVLVTLCYIHTPAHTKFRTGTKSNTRQCTVILVTRQMGDRRLEKIGRVRVRLRLNVVVHSSDFCRPVDSCPVGVSLRYLATNRAMSQNAHNTVFPVQEAFCYINFIKMWYFVCLVCTYCVYECRMCRKRSSFSRWLRNRVGSMDNCNWALCTTVCALLVFILVAFCP